MTQFFFTFYRYQKESVYCIETKSRYRKDWGGCDVKISVCQVCLFEGGMTSHYDVGCFKWLRLIKEIIFGIIALCLLYLILWWLELCGNQFLNIVSAIIPICTPLPAMFNKGIKKEFLSYCAIINNTLRYILFNCEVLKFNYINKIPMLDS